VVSINSFHSVSPTKLPETTTFTRKINITVSQQETHSSLQILGQECKNASEVSLVQSVECSVVRYLKSERR